MKYLDLADLVVIAAAILEIEEEAVLETLRLGLAESALAAPADRSEVRTSTLI